VWLVIGLLILLSISNTLTMAVMERTSEIGTMMALGLRRRKVLRLFLNEGVVLGMVGGILGVSVGWALALLISYVGIPMPPPPGMDVGFTAEIMVTRTLAFAALTMAVIATTLAAVYPAWKASRLEIVHALRHNR
jgi:putative ABC transport system permease protein